MSFHPFTLSLGILTIGILGCDQLQQNNSSSVDGSSESVTRETERVGDMTITTEREKRQEPGYFLKSYRDKSPVLVVFGDDRSKFMNALSSHEQTLQEHGVVVVEVFDLSRAQPQGMVRGGEKLTNQAALDVHLSLGPRPTGITAVLVGLDGKIMAKEIGASDPQVLLEKLGAQ